MSWAKQHDAYKGGWHSARGGKPVLDNPYPVKTSDHSLWLAGWYGASKRVRGNRGDQSYKAETYYLQKAEELADAAE